MPDLSNSRLERYSRNRRAGGLSIFRYFFCGFLVLLCFVASLLALYNWTNGRDSVRHIRYLVPGFSSEPNVSPTVDSELQDTGAVSSNLNEGATRVGGIATNVKNIIARQERQDYYGRRLHPDTLADFDAIQRHCAGDNWRDTRNCMHYLSENQSDYLVEPEDGSDHTAPIAFPAPGEAWGSTCPGKVSDIHAYWTGPPSWRVRVMIKSFLFTQNLPCTRLRIWFDADLDPEIISVAMDSVYLGVPFQNLIKAGLIVLQEWKFPDVVPLTDPSESTADDPTVVRFRNHQIPRRPVGISDAVRFIVLHQYGGLYIDMDNLFLRDIRPLLQAPNISFAERWGVRTARSEYNTAIMSLQPYSALTSFILEGASRIGCNFHPLILGRMLLKEGWADDLRMMEAALFDPLWPEFDRGREGNCTTPCLTNYGQAYLSDPLPAEWSTFTKSPFEVSPELQGVVGYFNRTMEHFFTGSFTYHIHNGWGKRTKPHSWLDVAEGTYDDWIAGLRTNPYGEKWQGPFIPALRLRPENSKG